MTVTAERKGSHESLALVFSSENPDTERWQNLQRLANIGKQASEMMHEIKNSLFILNGNIEYLKIIAGHDSALASPLNDIEQISTRLSNLTKAFFALRSSNHEPLQRLDVNEEVRHAVGLLPRFESSRVEVHLNLSSASLSVNARQSDLSQILMNIFVNALEAMPAGGTLHITTGLGDATKVPASRATASRYAAITISDTGIGMDKQVQEHLFEMSYSTKTHGTGLGLAVVSRIVAQMNGWIDVTSAPGQGATFTVYLPAHDIP